MFTFLKSAENLLNNLDQAAGATLKRPAADATRANVDAVEDDGSSARVNAYSGAPPPRASKTTTAPSTTSNASRSSSTTSSAHKHANKQTSQEDEMWSSLNTPVKATVASKPANSSAITATRSVPRSAASLSMSTTTTNAAMPNDTSTASTPRSSSSLASPLVDAVTIQTDDSVATTTTTVNANPPATPAPSSIPASAFLRTPLYFPQDATPRASRSEDGGDTTVPETNAVVEESNGAETTSTEDNTVANTSPSVSTGATVVETVSPAHSESVVETDDVVADTPPPSVVVDVPVVEATPIVATGTETRDTRDTRVEMTALRERVRTLSQQLAEASSAARDANETLDASIRQVKQLQNEIVSKDRKLEKLRASESQLDAQLKQSQRQAAEQQSALADLQRQLTNSESERRALRVELTDARSAVLASSSGVSAALEAALARADAAEAAREAALSEARSATIAATRAADDNRALSQQVEATLASSQLTLDASERRASKYAEQLRAALDDLEQLRAEHEQYKSEARRVLASASEASSGDGMAAAAAAASDSSALVLAAANARVSALERELTLARQTTRDVERARDAERANAATTLADAHNAAAAAELEVRTLRAALAADSEAAAARITALQNEVDTLAHKYALAQRDNEALRARPATTASTASGDAERERGELEARLRAMTEHLIAKQSQFEALSAERAYLQLKVEQLEQQRDSVERLRRTVASSALAAAVAGSIEPMASLIRRRDDQYGGAVTRASRVGGAGADDDDDDDDGDRASGASASAATDLERGDDNGKSRRRAGGVRAFVRRAAIRMANAIDKFSSLSGE